LKLQDIPRKVIPYCFIILSAASTVYVVTSTVNYLGFYSALNNITSSISGLTLLPKGASNMSTLRAWVIISNPSDYSGFKVADLSLTIYFLPSNMSNTPLFQYPPLLGGQTYFVALPPHSRTSLNITTSLGPTDTSSLSYYLLLNRYKVTAHCDLGGDISTFLDTAVGFVPITGTVQDLPLLAL
jgi:hypothetical protein